MSTIALHSVQNEVKRLIPYISDLELLKQFFWLQKSADLLSWIDFLETLEHKLPKHSDALLAELGLAPDQYAILDQPAERDELLGSWIHEGNCMDLAAGIVYLVRVQNQVVHLTGELQLIAQHELIRRFGIPVVYVNVYVNARGVSCDAKPSLVIYETFENHAECDTADTADTASVHSSESHKEDKGVKGVMYQVLPDAMTEMNLRCYNRLKHALDHPTYRGNWVSKGEVLRKLSDGNTHELDTMRSATWLWTRRSHYRKAAQSPESDGLLMRQSPSRQWYFRWNVSK